MLDPLDPSEPFPEPFPELFSDPFTDPTPVSPVPTLVQYSLDCFSSTCGFCCWRKPAYASRMSSQRPELRLIT